MAIEIRKWDAEKDILVTDQHPLLSDKDPYIIEARKGFKTYSINTAKGCYRVGRQVGQDQYSDLHDLMYYDGKTEQTIFIGVQCIYVYQYHKLLFICDRKKGHCFVIDSRGILFEFTDYVIEQKTIHPLVPKIDFNEGYYLICDKFKMFFRNKAQQADYHECTKADENAVINDELSRFINKNKHNENKYLYLTGGKSKCGVFLDYFISRGMEYEILPNLLSDDETINIRIPFFGENANRKDVHFLTAKYHNTYSIQNVPIDEICFAMNLSRGYNQMYGAFVNVSSQKQKTVFAIINTLRSLYPGENNDVIFKKALEKLFILMKQGTVGDLSNDFSTHLLLYIEDPKMSLAYLKEQQSNICSLLGISDASLLWDKTSTFFGFNRKMYIDANFAAWKKRKELIREYEAHVMQEITAEGRKISKWVNESELYSMVVKHYSDAVYQYRVAWLGTQSLDVYIPSLKVGIEYQGVQHYEPVPFFGGEEGFKKVQERDQRKAELCIQNGVILICWRYDEPISASRLKTKLKDAGITTV